MKRLLFVLLSALFLTACNDADNPPVVNYEQITVDSCEYIVFNNGGLNKRSYFVIHKQNCRHCQNK